MHLICVFLPGVFFTVLSVLFISDFFFCHQLLDKTASGSFLGSAERSFARHVLQHVPAHIKQACRLLLHRAVSGGEKSWKIPVDLLTNIEGVGDLFRAHNLDWHAQETETSNEAQDISLDGTVDVHEGGDSDSSSGDDSNDIGVNSLTLDEFASSCASSGAVSANTAKSVVLRVMSSDRGVFDGSALLAFSPVLRDVIRAAMPLRDRDM